MLSLSALAQSERLYLDTDFNFDFDNTEYKSVKNSENFWNIDYFCAKNKNKKEPMANG